MGADEIVQIIIDHARDVVPTLREHAFHPDESLRDLGANSVDRSEIVMMTLESLSLRIPMIEVARAGNISELAAILHEKMR
jgi:polyketide biosynthesis acyl carrier protein